MQRSTSPISNRAFTLVESMMAIVILAFAVCALSTVLYAAAKNAEAGGNKNIAVDVTRNDIESLLANKLSDLSPATGAATDEVIPSASLSSTDQPVTHIGGIKYISRSGTQAARDLAIIKVATTTQDGQTVTFQRLITRAGASQ